MGIYMRYQYFTQNLRYRCISGENIYVTYKLL